MEKPLAVKSLRNGLERPLNQRAFWSATSVSKLCDPLTTTNFREIRLSLSISHSKEPSVWT